MKCCSMRLANRSEMRQSFFQKEGRRCLASLQNRGGSSRQSLSNSSSRHSEDSQPFLSVLNLFLPSDLKAFNTGSSTDKWASKRPRLKSAKAQNGKDDSSMVTDLDSLDVSNLIKELQSEYCEDEEVKPAEDAEEVDPDIQRLIEETSNSGKKISFELEEDKPRKMKRKTKRKAKKKAEEDAKPKTKLTKTVSFSISKPPTPQTEQIIRVEVVSNYSIEFDERPNRTDGMSSERSGAEKPPDARPELVLKLFCSEAEEVSNRNFVLESKKAMLFPRGEKKDEEKLENSGYVSFKS